jgi:hypothetical protein
MGGAGGPCNNISEFEKYLKEIAESIVTSKNKQLINSEILLNKGKKECQKI